MSADDASWDYVPDGNKETDEPEEAEETYRESERSSSSRKSFSWTASEFIEHQRGFGWYLVLGVSTAALAALVYILFKDYFATGIIILVGFIVAFGAGRKPRELEYKLSASGLQIGAKTFPYSQFKSFSIIREGKLVSLTLLPMKKFALPIAAYFDPKDEAKVVAAIGENLPYEERQPDGIDRLSQRLKF